MYCSTKVSQEVEQVADEALDDADFESKHNRDEQGRFTKVGFNNAEPDNKGSAKTIERKPFAKQYGESLKNKSISKSEYKIIEGALNKKFAGKPLPKSGYSSCRTANFVYKVRVFDYDVYKPIRRWRIP